MNKLNEDLFAALEANSIKKVKALLAKSPDLEVMDPVDMTALTIAARDGSMEMVKLLIEHGSLVTSDTLMVAGMSTSSSPEIVNFLQHEYMKQVAPVVDELSDADALLVNSANAGDLDGIKKALKDGANIQAFDELDTSALRWAIRKGHDKAVEEILGAGSDVNHVSENGWTPLMEAAASGNKVLVDLLTEKGAISDFTNQAGQTAASVANEGGHAAIAEQLAVH